MKNQAILITAYKNFDYLCSLAENLVDNFDVYIHIDKKSKERKSIIENISR